jgi:aromatic-L-amino-acid decarboxylase
MASRLRRTDGIEVLNDVVLNQVLVCFRTPAGANVTPDVIREVQASGVCWCGGTVWAGEPAMRISVSNWRTDEADIDRSADAIERAHTLVSAGRPGF